MAHPLATAVENGEVDRGIALCGTGNGMAMTLNHHRGIRAGLAWNTAVGKLVKEHNDANVLVMPARFISYRMAVSARMAAHRVRRRQAQEKDRQDPCIAAPLWLKALTI